MIRKGDVVEILAPYRDEGDELFTWVALTDEEKGRVDIQPVDIALELKPVYTVLSSQVRLISATTE